MANTQHNTPETNGVYMDAATWAAAMAKRGFVVIDGVPCHGSGGHIVSLPVPNWSDPGVQAMVAQALAEYGCNRIVQNAKDGKAQSDLADAFAKGDVDAGEDGDESRRVKLVEKLVREELTARIKEKAPNVSDADLEATIRANHDAMAKVIVARGSYKVAEKKKSGKAAPGTGTVIALDLTC